MIATFSQWWNEMATVTQVFYVAASFFSLIFIWQFVASMIGMSGCDMDVDGAGDADFDVDVDGIDADCVAHAIDNIDAFNLFSIRAILAFCTLFFWAGAMYLDQGMKTAAAMAYSFGWGLAGWLVVTILVNWMRKLAETGNPRIASCVGTHGAVYMDIPENGIGKVRVTVTGAISMVAARSEGGVGIQAGTPVEVISKIDNSTVEVRTTGSTKPTDPTINGKENDK
jgi:hypothetical protein